MSYEIYRWVLRQWPPDPDNAVEYYLWADFVLDAALTAWCLICVVCAGLHARLVRDMLRKTRVREGRAAGPHDTADNVRDILRALTFDTLPWLR